MLIFDSLTYYAGFIPSPNEANKFQCTICSRFATGPLKGIEKDSVTRHVTGKAHERNKIAYNRSGPQTTIEARNEAINVELGAVEIAAVKTPLERDSFHIPSAAEREMWNDYDMNGAVFTAGDDPALLLAQERANLAREADKFGVWNARSMARQLGFSTEEGDSGPDERDEADAVLCEMLDNARMSQISLYACD